MAKSSNISIGQVFTIHSWLEQSPVSQDLFAELDGQTRQKITQNPTDTDVDVLLNWWRLTHSHDAADTLVSVRSIAVATLVLVGGLVGISVTSLALKYTGDYPVNLLVVLGLLLFLPTITLLLAVIARSLGAKTSFGSAAMHSLIGMSKRVLGTSVSDYLNNNLWRYSQAMYWTGQSLVQWFSVATLVSALATMLVLLALTDIAFGWSSTLQIHATAVHTLTEFLSLPWQAWLPSAHPSIELVENSRFYRMNPTNDPTLLGQWWPFIVMSICVWALLPRLVFVFFCQYKVRSSSEQALLNHPEVTALLDQLRGTAVQYEADTYHHENEQSPLSTQDSPNDSATDAPTSTPVISWNGASSDSLQVRLGDNDHAYQALFEQLGKDHSQIRIVVKGWEPPLLEFNDFIHALRTFVGRDAKIHIEPRALDGQTLADNDTAAWRTTLAKTRDPHVYLRHST